MDGENSAGATAYGTIECSSITYDETTRCECCSSAKLSRDKFVRKTETALD